MLQMLLHTKWFFIQIPIIHDKISSQKLLSNITYQTLVQQLAFGELKVTWDDKICLVTPRKCHQKIYQSDVTYDMTPIHCLVSRYGC